MKKVTMVLVIVVAVVMGASLATAARAEWKESILGTENGFGLGLYPGDNTEAVWSLQDYLFGDDFTDKIFHGSVFSDTAGYQLWKQSGFPGTRIVAAKLTVASTGYRAGTIYIRSNATFCTDVSLSPVDLKELGCLKKVGDLTPSESSGTMVKNSFDLKNFIGILKWQFVYLVIEIPFISGTFGLDNGVVDYVKIEAYGN